MRGIRASGLEFDSKTRRLYIFDRGNRFFSVIYDITRRVSEGNTLDLADGWENADSLTTIVKCLSAVVGYTQ